MQIYRRAKLLLGDQITNPAFDRHAFDKLASTSWLRQAGFDKLASTSWLRQAGFDKLSQRIAAPELDRLSSSKPVETSNPQEATFS
ncbi:hypothetical protein FBQ85_13065 [Cytophagia bacterium CHB2]|nr:hypothetical protein [Cytophagia bacterium CHB2]